MACSQNPETYLGARYRRIASLRGPMKANVAIWHMGRKGTLYDDPGADFFTRLHPERAKNRALHQLEAMGYQVTFGRTGLRKHRVLDSGLLARSKPVSPTHECNPRA